MNISKVRYSIIIGAVIISCSNKLQKINSQNKTLLIENCSNGQVPKSGDTLKISHLKVSDTLLIKFENEAGNQLSWTLEEKSNYDQSLIYVGRETYDSTIIEEEDYMIRYYVFKFISKNDNSFILNFSLKKPWEQQSYQNKSCIIISKPKLALN